MQLKPGKKNYKLSKESVVIFYRMSCTKKIRFLRDQSCMLKILLQLIS